MKRIPRGGTKVNYTLYVPSEEREKIQNRAKELDMTDAYYLLELVKMDTGMQLMEHVQDGGIIAPVYISEPTVPGEFQEADHEHTGTPEEVQRQLIEEDLNEDDIEQMKQQIYANQNANPENVALAPGESPTAESLQEAEAALQESINEGRQEEIAMPSEEELQKIQAADQERQKPQLQRPQMKSIQDVVAEQTGVFQSVVSQPGSNVRNPNVSDSQKRAAQKLGEVNWQDSMHQALTADERGETQMRKKILENLPPEKEEGES